MEWLDSWSARIKELKAETIAMYLACRDHRTPWYAKVVAALVVAYALSPIDLVPDFIPVLGMLDDLVLLPLGLLFVRRLIPPTVMEDCRARAETISQHDKPTSWLAAAVIVAIWLVAAYITYLLARCVFL